MSITLGTKPPKPSYQTERRPLFPSLAEKPKCPSDSLFIWDAIKLAGSTLLADEWDGHEMAAMHWPISPEQGVENAKARTQQQLATHKQWSGSSMSKRADPTGDGAQIHNQHVIDYLQHVASSAKAAFDEAVRKEQAEWELNQTRVARLERVCEWLAAHFREGTVLSRYRFTGIPGQLVNEDASAWNIEGAFRNRFIPGSYERWFTSSAPARQLPVYIFVDRAMLQAAIKAVSVPPAQSVSDPTIKVEELSKYLQLALHVHTLGFGPAFDGGKKDVRKALVEAASLFDLTLSANQEEYLATFLRNEDAQLGKNK